MQSPLTTRQQSILNRVVDYHIASAQPVGSQAITSAYRESYRVSFSPATVRNEMGTLEDKGYLTHPHTSAGRIPTDLGYRYYVDHCLRPEVLPADIFSRLADQLNSRLKQTDSFAEKASAALCAVTGEVSLVVVSEDSYPARDIRTRSGNHKVFFQGLARLLEKPEFQEVPKIRSLFQALEEKMTLVEWLLGKMVSKGVTVAIGEELDSEAFRDCAVVATAFSGGEGQSSGAVAILGPRRMRYSRTVPAINEMAKLIGRALDPRHSGLSKE